MKRFAVTLTLLTALTSLMPVSASAAGQQDYRQIDSQSQPSYLLAATPVYQGSTTYSQSATLQSPETILNHLKSANNVPADIKPTIEVQKSDVLNAATDGQNLIITSALLDRLTTNDQRAFVISHELSHILLQHIAKTQMRRVGLSLFDAFVVRRYTAQGSIAQLASELGIGLVDKRSSRGYEYQADDLGVKLMTQAGYNPQAAIQVFDILKAAAPGNSTPEFLQDHPITDSRIRALVQKYKLSGQ